MNRLLNAHALIGVAREMRLVVVFALIEISIYLVPQLVPDVEWEQLDRKPAKMIVVLLNNGEEPQNPLVTYR